MTQDFDSLSDIELVVELKKGNQDAFQHLAVRYSERMYRTAYAMLNNHHDAEEVVQEALMRAYRALPNFRGDSSLATWLQRIVANLSRNKLQWNKRRGSEVNSSISAVLKKESSDEFEDVAIPDSKLSPERQAHQKDISNSVTWAIKQMPEHLKVVVVLRYIHDYSYNDIAKTLGCSLGSVKSRLSRGRELLIELLHNRDLL